MTSRDLYIDNKVLDIEVLAEKAKVMIEDIEQGYFGESINSENAWRVMPPFYDHASVKANIINDIIFNLVVDLKNLRSVLNSNDDDVEREIKIYDLMDKHNCDRDVAELLLQDQEEKTETPSAGTARESK
ncbi:MAG: hypothetical protein LBQ71_14870 [Hungatella sp.]|jgi:hypothetical protein|nr:hypothetical protein [Hungatella sp.]